MTRGAGALLGLALLAAGTLPFAQSRPPLDAKRVRDLLRRLGGAELDTRQVHIKSIDPGIGNQVIVEAQIETAFRLEPDGREWRVAEIRLGDQQWLPLELVEEAVRREKARRTLALLQQLAEGLDAYRRDRGRYVAAEEVGIVLDQLAPRYLSTPSGADLWGTPFKYRGAAGSYRLASAGPDRAWETRDDLVVENGSPRAPAQ
jgi:hypothetical protein